VNSWLDRLKPTSPAIFIAAGAVSHRARAQFRAQIPASSTLEQTSSHGSKPEFTGECELTIGTVPRTVPMELTSARWLKLFCFRELQSKAAV
jgi:hypothetical protein